MLSGAVGVLAGSVKFFVDGISLLPIMVGSTPGLPHQHIYRFEGRDNNFGAETILAFAVFTFHILDRASDIFVLLRIHSKQLWMQ